VENNIKRNRHRATGCSEMQGLVGRKVAQQITTFLVLATSGLACIATFLFGSIWAILLVVGFVIFDLALYFRWLSGKRRVQYPIVPPEGRGDMYLPRTDIPRPVVEDFRKIEEKKRKFKKLNRLMRRTKRVAK